MVMINAAVLVFARGSSPFDSTLHMPGSFTMFYRAPFFLSGRRLSLTADDGFSELRFYCPEVFCLNSSCDECNTAVKDDVLLDLQKNK